jgi:lipooligosaccharide transport system permease protein
MFLDRWPDEPVRLVGVLAGFAAASFWVALALTRKRFRS